ncbi:MAG: ribonuclease III [Bdellovibrionales bacterium]|nr:ribonuclease III [Bdellovibrionales bacterium]
MTSNEPVIPSIEKALASQFQSSFWYELALTHKSFKNENAHVSGDNERLEFLGDAVLSLVLSDELMTRFPEATEGVLSRLRASLVNENSLFTIANQIELAQFLRLGRGEVQSGGTQKPRLLASAVEALIGAVYSDGGYEKARISVLHLFRDKLNDPSLLTSFDMDFKTRLQELWQKKTGQVPKYTLIAEIGPEHDKSFEFEVTLNNEVTTRGIGKSKKLAEQDAAKKSLDILEGRAVDPRGVFSASESQNHQTQNEQEG